MILLLVYLVLAIGVSFLCSLLEAGLLSVPRGHVAVMIDRGQPAGRRLEAMKRDIERPLSAILTLNTVAHTVGAAGVGAQSAVVFGSAWLGVTSAVLTVLVLVFSEIIPKTLGTRNAKRLAPFTASAVRWLMIGTHPIIVALEWVNRVVARGRLPQARLTREELRALAQLGGEEGALEPGESRIMMNMIAMREIEVGQIITPRKMVKALDQSKTVGRALDEDGPLTFARMPVYEGNIDHLTGLVTRYDVNNAAREGRGDQTLAELARPIEVIPQQASVADALDQFLDRQAHLMQVVDEYGGTAGVVSLEDVVETLLGVEIIDETDLAVDLQALARQTHLRQQMRQTTPPERPGGDDVGGGG